jgi:hypothetical protein
MEKVLGIGRKSRGILDLLDFVVEGLERLIFSGRFIFVKTFDKVVIKRAVLLCNSAIPEIVLGSIHNYAGCEVNPPYS